MALAAAGLRRMVATLRLSGREAEVTRDMMSKDEVGGKSNFLFVSPSLWCEMCCVAPQRKALRSAENDGVSAAAHLSWRREGGDWSRRTRQEKGERKREGTGESESYNGGEKIVVKRQSRTRRKRPQELLTTFSRKRITRKRALMQFIPSQGRVHSFVRIAVQQTRIINYAGGGVGVAPAPASGYVCQLPQEVHHLP